MQTIRRIYLYVMSGVTLGVIGVGLSMLLDVILTSSGALQHPYGNFGGDYGNFGGSSRQMVSQAIALLGVGVPVWAVHWWFVQRGLASVRPGHEAERGSPIRALYLSIVLVVSLAAWVNGAIGLAQGLLADLTKVSQTFFIVDPVNSATALAVGLLIWVFHGLIRRQDLASGPVHGAAAWLPRLYVYGVALGALVIAAGAVEPLVVGLVSTPPSRDEFTGVSLIGTGLTCVAWALIWLGHWRYATLRAMADDPRGIDERESRTRLGAFIATIVIASSYTLVGIVRTLEAVIRPLLGMEPGENESLTMLVVEPLAIAIPWAIVWFGHARWLHRDPATTDPLRRLHVSRLESHGVAAVALAFGAVALGWLIGLAIDAAFGGLRTSGSEAFPSAEFATWLPMAVVGTAGWVWQWSNVLVRRRLNPDEEANSTIRRTFLYLALGVAVVAGLGSATVILYRLVGSLLGASLSGNTVSELSTPLGAVVVAVAVLVYHGLQLRRDQSLRGEAPAPLAGPAPVGAPSAALAQRADPSATMTDRTLVLVGPVGADLDAALAAARAVLPEGIRLEEPSVSSADA